MNILRLFYPCTGIEIRDIFRLSERITGEKRLISIPAACTCIGLY